jgi:hypothetical protein
LEGDPAVGFNARELSSREIIGRGMRRASGRICLGHGRKKTSRECEGENQSFHIDYNNSVNMVRNGGMLPKREASCQLAIFAKRPRAGGGDPFGLQRSNVVSPFPFFETQRKEDVRKMGSEK